MLGRASQEFSDNGLNVCLAEPALDRPRLVVLARWRRDLSVYIDLGTALFTSSQVGDPALGQLQCGEGHQPEPERGSSNPAPRASGALGRCDFASRGEGL